MAQGEDKKKLDNLLKLTLKLQDEETKNYESSEMEEERKAFLQSAINSMLDQSDEKKLRLFTGLFLRYEPDQTFSEKDLVEVVNVFEELSFLIEAIDMAKDFNQLGGLKHCLVLMKSKYSSIQWRAADLLANCSQNNPPCQDTMMKNNGVVTLLHILRTTDVDIVKLKCIYAISAILGNHQEAEKLFIRLKGINDLLNIVKSDMGKLQMKSAFLINKIIQSEFEKSLDLKYLCSEFLNLLVHQEHTDAHEIIAKMILHVVEEDENIVNDIFANKKEIKRLLGERKQLLLNKDGEKYLDEASIYDQILKIISKGA